VTVQTVLAQLATYLGGPYDPTQRTYHQSPPVVPGLYSVRRAWAKQEDAAAYFYGAPPGTKSGCAMVVQIPDGTEHRVAVGGAVSGVKRLAHAVELHCFIRSSEPYPEDSQDFGYGLRDAIFARIRADRTCGSGGFEAGGFQVGEGGEPWLRWHLSQATTKAELTKLYLKIDFEAHEYIQA
jgi:hypothetical protein